VSPNIPAYDDLGRHAGYRSPRQADLLITQGLYCPEFNRKGVVIALHRRGSVRATAYIGTRYSFREHLRDGHITWKLKPMPRPDSHGDLFVRAIFRRVALDCMA